MEVLIEEYKIDRRVRALAHKITEEHRNSGNNLPPVMICVLNGAFMFAADLLKSITLPCEISFVKVSSYHGGMSTTGRVDELIGLNASIENKEVIILEDIVDTGITIDKIITLLKAESPASVKVCTLLYKPDAFKGKKAPELVGMSIPNKFVVGYGLDYDEKGRNLREIYQLKED